ncbi:hypothetical protein GCM10028803_36360 [Larkinella knui]|uniref:LysM peptidoglycan-binding domain-containing protein n=1 Tax=Larkinella knui TaxID=2025310 RepID=A0A3P1CEH2_9BACT|nr:LysM peptidoglycan-binding domain-containing protein [Larkinella knui]RRB11496.1 LysM peptidoglycan-binding domain-containing protein [Larkinella knui]
MKKRLSTLSLILFFTHSFLFSGQAQVPAEVPESIRFADLNVRFDEGARRIIRQDITSLVQSNKKYWEAKLDRVVLYFPLIEAILAEEEVPVDLKYLAVQESSLVPDAVSASTAVGYWQFKKETATDHGMRVDDEVDERKSIVASTRGAARYFKRNNAVYNNWVSSLFSYYLGTTGISKLVPAEWSYAREVTLDDKTDRYILRFFAHKIAFENVLPAYRTTNSMALVAYPYGSGKTVSQVSEDLKINEIELRKYNRWILGDEIPADKEYVLAIPATGDQVAALRRQALKAQAVSQTKAPESAKVDTGFPVLRKVNYSKGKPDVVLYEINGLPGIQALAGDNASTLARKARVSVSSFLRYNDMSDRDPVTENEVYYLAKKMRKAVVPHHTVQVGETARSISQMYGIRLKKLLRYNRIDRSDRLQVGRVMWLRERRPGNQPVEIIKTPATPAPSSRPIASQPTASPSEPRLSQSSTTDRPANSIPKNASERKMYSPKLVEPKESPATTSPTTPDSRVSTTNTGSAPVSSQPVDSPASTMTKPPVAAPTTSSPSTTVQNSGSTQRVVIVRPENSTKSDWDATPVRTTTPAPAPVSRPTERKPAEPAPVTASVKRPTTETTDEVPTRETTSSKPAPVTVAKTTGSSRSTTHKVEAGQTYYSISRLYHVSVDDLLQWNKLTQNDKLAVGQSLVIKGEGDAVRSQPVSAASPTADPLVTEEIVYHTVQKGETMFRISKQYGVTVEQIQTWNQLSGGGVNVGQQLKIIKK